VVPHHLHGRVGVGVVRPRRWRGFRGGGDRGRSMPGEAEDSEGGHESWYGRSGSEPHVRWHNAKRHCRR
jgi:hypothetical protein